MTISQRERLLVASIGGGVFLIGSVWLSIANAATRPMVAAIAAPLAQSIAIDASVEHVVKTDVLTGQILDPFGVLTGVDSANKSTADEKRSQGVNVIVAAPGPDSSPADKMQFNLEHVPAMINSGGAGDAVDSVYALGTGSAILTAGGRIVHEDDTIGALRIVKIDGTGIYLSNGSILRERAAPVATPKAAAPVTPADSHVQATPTPFASPPTPPQNPNLPANQYQRPASQPSPPQESGPGSNYLMRRFPSAGARPSPSAGENP